MWKPKANRISIPLIKHLIIKWKRLLVFIILSVIAINYVFSNRRYQPNITVDYSLIDDEHIPLYDDKFVGEAMKNVPISLRSMQSDYDDVFQYGCRDPLIEAKKPREKAAFVVLARNSEIDGVILSMRSLERRFNQWFNYPWIFLNDEPFDDEFKERTKEVASGALRFGQIPTKEWEFPNNDDVYFKEAIENQGDRKIMYGNMPSYHSMCRFYSGYFFEHELVKSLDWYWRVEPYVDFYCDLTYDPFVEMKKHGKKYGYTIAIKELVNTVPNLFRYTKNFMEENNLEIKDSWDLFTTKYNFLEGEHKQKYNSIKNLNSFYTRLESELLFQYANLKINDSIKNHGGTANLDNEEKYLLSLIASYNKNRNNVLEPLVPDKLNNEEYNLCHFWSNFEIASNDLFTSPGYKKYYDYLEESKGFYTERWGDAPIHSLAAGLFLDLNEIHYFRDIGYKHSTLGHCPFNSFENQLEYKPGPRFKHQVLPEDEKLYADYDKPPSKEKSLQMGAPGCRCRCPSDHREIEDSGGSCSALWLKLTSDEFNNDLSSLHGGLGVKKFLDLDKIEKTVLIWISQWVADGNSVKNWKLSESQKKILSKMYTTNSSNSP